MLVKLPKITKGFTLVELVVGIVLMSVALMGISAVLMPQLKRGVDPIWQVRAVTLGQSLLTEISSKAFDENSISTNGRSACNNTVDCSTAINLGNESGESRERFDDIDDYHNLQVDGAQIINANNEIISSNVSDLFSGFSARVTVFYDDNADGINDADPNNDGNLDNPSLIGNQKLITVTIITPDGSNISFANYRTNY